MKLEIPEGTYTVTVANEGYGGSTEVEIARGETCTLDLDELKGEGPKTGSIIFYIDVEGATLSIDGDTVDYSAPVVLTYGVHTLHAEAEGYDDFDKKLFVNSAAANIDISLTGDGTTSDNDMTEWKRPKLLRQRQKTVRRRQRVQKKIRRRQTSPRTKMSHPIIWQHFQISSHR